MNDDGVLVTDRAGDRLVFRRHLPHARSVVWRALVDPARRAEWFFAGTLEVRVGGRVDLEHEPGGIVGEVTEVQEERLLAFTWDSSDGPHSAVRFELSDAPGGTLLVFTHLVDGQCDVPGLLAGWHHLLDRAAGHLSTDGVPDEPGRYPWLREHYHRTVERVLRTR